MDLCKLSNSDLHNSFKNSVQRERNSLTDVLLHIIEVDRRHMYFDYDCASLFVYMTDVMGYTNGPAQRRIDAARLSYEVPQIVESIESGALKLDHIRLMQQSIRQVVKENHKSVTVEQKIQVLNEIVGKSIAESEAIVARSLAVTIKTSVKVQRQADESVRMEISFSKKQWAKLEEMRTLLSHSLPSGSWDDVFEYVADKVIQQKSKLVEKRKYAKRSGSSVNEKETSLKKDDKKLGNKNMRNSPRRELANTANKISNLSLPIQRSTMSIARTAIPAEIERQVYKRDQFCQHKNPLTGRMCATKWKLQMDHIVPVWAGGDNSLENLKLLCANHNQAKYRKEAGIRREKTCGFGM